MGFFEDLNVMLNRGTEAATRMADTASFKIKLASLDGRYKELAAQLGEGLYERVVQDPALSAGLEHILADMASLEAERKQVREEIARVEREAAGAKAAATVYSCPACGAALQSNARFCPACGVQLAQPVAEPQPAAQPVYTQVNTPAQPQQPNSNTNYQPEAASQVYTQTYEVPDAPAADASAGDASADVR